MEGLKKAQQLRLEDSCEIRSLDSPIGTLKKGRPGGKGQWVFVGSILTGLLILIFFVGVSYSPSDTNDSKKALPSPEIVNPPAPIKEAEQQVNVEPHLIPPTESPAVRHSGLDQARPVPDTGESSFPPDSHWSLPDTRIRGGNDAPMKPILDRNVPRKPRPASDETGGIKERKKKENTFPESPAFVAGRLRREMNGAVNPTETKNPVLPAEPIPEKPLPSESLSERQSPTASSFSVEKTVLNPIEAKREIKKDAPSVSDVLSQFNLAVSLHRRKEISKAVHAYLKVLELDPTHIEAYNNLGLLYQEMGEFEKAQEAYQKSIEINPRYEKAYNNIGILFLTQGREEEALEAFQKALTLNPKNAESHINLGILHKKRGQPHKAIESYQRALSIEPLQGEAHYNIGLLYEQLENLDQALYHYQEFVQIASSTYPGLVSKIRRHMGDLMKRSREKSR